MLGKIPKSVSFILYYSHCAFPYIAYFNQQNAPIKAQKNIPQNTLHVRYQLLHIAATWRHPQGVKNNKIFVSPKRVVVIVVLVIVVTIAAVFVIVVVVIIVVVRVEFSCGLVLSYKIRFVCLGQDITNNFVSVQP